MISLKSSRRSKWVRNIEESWFTRSACLIRFRSGHPKLKCFNILSKTKYFSTSYPKPNRFSYPPVKSELKVLGIYFLNRYVKRNAHKKVSAYSRSSCNFQNFENREFQGLGIVQAPLDLTKLSWKALEGLLSLFARRYCGLKELCSTKRHTVP